MAHTHIHTDTRHTHTLTHTRTHTHTRLRSRTHIGLAVVLTFCRKNCSLFTVMLPSRSRCRTQGLSFCVCGFFFFLLPTSVVSTMIISRELHGITSKPGDLGTKISRHSTDCRYSCRMPVHSGVSVSSGGKCRKQQTGFKLLFVSCDVILSLIHI